MKQKGVWRVRGIHIDWCGEGSQTLFEAHFSNRDAAFNVYHKGEKEYGIAAGYTYMRWELEGFYLDDDQHIDQMFDDVKEANFGGSND